MTESIPVSLPASHADAVHRAQESLSLLGHPDQRWSITLHARLTSPVDRVQAAARLAAELAQRPALGPVPVPVSIAPSELESTLHAFAEQPYAFGDSALRVALVDRPEPGVLLAGHHGAVDGLGLIALLALVLGRPVRTNARGVTVDGSNPEQFVVFAARRVIEALFWPPTRIAGQPAGTAVGDSLAECPVRPFGGGASGLTAAAVRGVARWNGDHGASARRITVAIGASQRSGAEPTLEHRAAWMRIRARSGDDQQIAAMVRAAHPLPVGPAQHNLAGIGRLASGLLSRRLGSTLLVSNLGVVNGPPELDALSFYPVTHGHRAVALGAATVDDRTVLTMRSEARDFDATSLGRLLSILAGELEQAGT